MAQERPAPAARPATSPDGDIIAVARAVTAQADRDLSSGVLIIAARDATGAMFTIGGEARGPLRAAVSVAIAAGNTRLWDACEVGATVEQQVRALPEIVRAAAEAQGLKSVHVGTVADDALAAVAMWFEVDGVVAAPAVRAETLQLLEAAAARQRNATEAERSAGCGASDETLPAASAAPQDTARVFDPNDPTIDAVTGLARHDTLDDALNDYDSDEVTLVVVDIDEFASVTEAHGSAVSNSVLREVADRLVDSCRSDDLIARTGDHTFAVLFADATRAIGLQVAKRLVDVISLPLPVAGGPEHVTATVVLAHQIGLVDTDELLESAGDAVASGRSVGAGRLVIAS